MGGVWGRQRARLRIGEKLVLKLLLFSWNPATDKETQAKRSDSGPSCELGDSNPGLLLPRPYLSTLLLSKSPKHGPS